MRDAGLPVGPLLRFRGVRDRAALGVGRLVVTPVADGADACRGEQGGGVRRLLEVWAGPANRARAGGLVDRRNRVADILPLLVLGHTNVDDAPAREAVRDELRVAPLPLLDQE